MSFAFAKTEMNTHIWCHCNYYLQPSLEGMLFCLKAIFYPLLFLHHLTWTPVFLAVKNKRWKRCITKVKTFWLCGKICNCEIILPWKKNKITGKEVITKMFVWSFKIKKFFVWIWHQIKYWCLMEVHWCI